MNSKRVSEVFQRHADAECLLPATDDHDIVGICYDSRDVIAGSIFVALPGLHVDGHDYIEAALDRGAVVLIVQKNDADMISAAQKRGAAVYFHSDTRSYLSAISATFYDTPADELIIIGVTGTDGKSSCVSFLSQLLNDLGVDTGFISTVSYQTGDTIESNNARQSTPEAPEIHRLLREMVSNGKIAAVIESTSHGLSPRTGRLSHVSYDAALFTNVTHEHLEFHGSFEQYRDDKANLFRKLRKDAAVRATANFSPQPVAVVNAADGSAAHFRKAAEEAGARIFEYRNAPSRDEMEETGSYALDVQVAPASSRFRLSFAASHGGTPVFLPVAGSFNIDNILACSAVLHFGFGFDAAVIADSIARLQPVKGRMVAVDEGQPFAAIVDYAHTPGSFESVFPVFRQSCKGRLIAVFGSAGERDVAKRPIQGKIASQFADILLITNEDPRLEDPMTIINDIIDGARSSGHPCECIAVEDRREAIRHAFQIAQKDDLVVMLGKGHEGSIIMADGKHPWDEETVAHEVLREIGHSKVERT